MLPRRGKAEQDHIEHARGVYRKAELMVWDDAVPGFGVRLRRANGAA